MKHLSINLFFLVATTAITTAFAQTTTRKDKASFINNPNAFYEGIQKSNKVFFEEKKEVKRKFMMDLTGIDIPKNAAEFKSVWIEKPISQGESGTCWSFSTTSFYEAEISRLTQQQIKLSELYIVYWQYVEKAKEFVRTRGKSLFDEGSETNGPTLTIQKYGIVPIEAYAGIKPGQPFHDHVKMVEEMKNFLASIKSSNNWNDELVTSTIKSIMNYYIGEPPTTVTVSDKTMTPLEYMTTVAKLNPEDYVNFMSLMEAPYWNYAEYKAPDNWWHSDDYRNVPLDDFMTIIKNAIKNNFSIAIGGDVSESGINSYMGVMMIPTYDIPSQFIDENARQLRFTNGSTTDDHAMHLVGYVEKSNGTWFLIKDSGSGGHNNVNNAGYYYMHEDFVKLKMMTITLHKDAAKDYLEKFPDRKFVKYVR